VPAHDESPRSITTVGLINKTDRRKTTFEPTHSGFQITNQFIYGYGLDWDQRFRDLPYIAIANPHVTVTGL
jgi:hypoxanthine phosphoribosyltransferase